MALFWITGKQAQERLILCWVVTVLRRNFKVNIRKHERLLRNLLVRVQLWEKLILYFTHDQNPQSTFGKPHFEATQKTLSKSTPKPQLHFVNPKTPNDLSPKIQNPQTKKEFSFTPSATSSLPNHPTSPSPSALSKSTTTPPSIFWAPPSPKSKSQKTPKPKNSTHETSLKQQSQISMTASQSFPSQSATDK